MVKKTLSALALAGVMAPGLAAAEDRTGCGLGTMVFDGQSGKASQVLAVTTNGTSGNQTFGISSGTLGCDDATTVNSDQRLSQFTGSNIDRLAADMSVGEGESLTTMAALLGVPETDRAHFYSVTQKNFARIFPTADTTAAEVIAEIKAVMAEDPRLAAPAA